MANADTLHRWWNDRPGESFWLEVTDRPDLGANLKAPQTNENGEPFWSYSLLLEVRAGDLVYHYERLSQAIVGVSRATGVHWEDALVWAARGTSARDAGILPHTRSGWYVGLEQFRRFTTPVSLDQLRGQQPAMDKTSRGLEAEVGKPLYLPFEIGPKRPLRPMQGYLFKFPRAFAEMFPVLRELPKPSPPEPASVIGTDYRRADEDGSVGQRDPFSIDPALVERGLRGHAITQNGLATFLRLQGLDPRSPLPEEPNFDLAWVAGEATWIAEIKSLTSANEEKQLRLGLGQVLRYRQIIGITTPLVKAALVAERKPTDASWEQLCANLGVLLVWPENWSLLLSS